MSLMRPSKKSFIQVLWTGIDASIPSLYLFTDNKRYIFNCGEGLQRLFTQRKMKLGKLDRFFFTRYQWSHIGGLPGFLMTLRDLKSGVPLITKSSQAFNDAGKSVEKENTGIEGEKNCSFESKDKTKTKIGSASKKQLNEEEPSIRPIDIYAPEGIENIIDATDSFLHVDDSDIKLRLNNYVWNKKLQCSEYKDEELTIYSIPIKSKLCMHAEKRQSCLPDTAIDENILSPLNPPSLCYACHLRPFPGKFDAKKAKELGIPVGPIRGNLQKGETVVLDNGKVITPQDVLGPEIPGTVFLIIDCPSACYIESLINNITLERYKSFENGPHLVMHLASDNVCGDSKYSEWVNKFPAHTKHIYLKDLAQGSIVYHSQYCKQFMLNRVNAKLFPLTSERIKKDSVNRLDGSVENFMIVKLRELIDKPVKAFDYSETNVQVNYSELMDKVRNAITNMNGNNEKNFNVCKNENYDCDHKQYTEFSLERKSANTSSNNKDSLAISNGKRCHEEALEATSNKKLIIDKSDNDDIIRHSKDTEKQTYPKIVCLGTGASLPSKYRNVSSTLVFLSEKDIVLLDCGEGTYGQMVRHYGESVNGILSKIKLIFISHMHADHHLGLITLINKLNSLKRICDDSSAVIMAPWLLCKWLSKYKRISEPLKFKFIDFKNSSISKNIHVKPVKVDHPGIAHGVVISYDDLKITYSGDTGPCNALVEAGMNSTLLIHEATLEDEMAEDAREMKHSTTSQAVEVAHKMKAQYVLFTHFSQRYPKIPVIRNELLLSRAAFAFDHMEVTLDDIWTFPELIPTITALYSDENEDMKGLEGLE